MPASLLGHSNGQRRVQHLPMKSLILRTAMYSSGKKFGQPSQTLWGWRSALPSRSACGLKCRKKQPNGRQIVRKYGLRSPAGINAFVGESFEFADFCFAYGADMPLRPAIVSTIKARQAGFRDCMDTEDMFRKWICHFQNEHLLPPR
jgi:hypothetical protein